MLEYKIKSIKLQILQMTQKISKIPHNISISKTHFLDKKKGRTIFFPEARIIEGVRRQGTAG